MNPRDNIALENTFLKIIFLNYIPLCAHTHTKKTVIVLNVLLLYHVYQASEQAETTRASFKQNSGLMVSSVRFSPCKSD